MAAQNSTSVKTQNSTSVKTQNSTSVKTLPDMGFSIGHVSGKDTGVTVIYCGEQGAVASVDVRGGGPGTRETDLLAPHNTVERVHALVLAGGSAFGLAAADGVMRELESHGVGFPVFGEGVDGPRVPIVPGAVIFDLLAGPHRPTAADGAEAARRALRGHDSATGSVGAGVGAAAGRLRGGFGLSSVACGEYTVAAAVVANPVGEVIDSASGRLFGAPGQAPVDVQRFGAARSLAEAHLNTTIGAVLCDAPVTKAQAKRLALAGHDGIARAVRPAHLPLDGDTLFAASSGRAHHPPVHGGAGQSTPDQSAPDQSAPAQNTAGVDTATLSALCAAAAQAVEQAIVSAVVSAEPGLGMTSYSSLLADH